MKPLPTFVVLAAFCFADVSTADDLGLVGKWVATKYGDTITVEFNDDKTVDVTNSDPNKAKVLREKTHYCTVLSENNPVMIEIVTFEDGKPDPLVTYTQSVTFLAPDLIEMTELRIHDGPTTERDTSLLLQRVE